MKYTNVLGRNASWRMQQWWLPKLRWNQEVFGSLLVERLSSRPDQSWLDAGCGHQVLAQGLESLEDAAVAAAGFTVGMDPYAPAIVAHRNIKNRAVGLLEKLPFGDNSFDVVTCNMVVEHLASPLECCLEIRRVLAPGGIAILHTPNLLNYMVFLNHTIGRIMPRGLVMRLIRISEDREEEDVFRTYYRMNTPRSVRTAAAKAGMVVEKQMFIPPPRPVFNFFLPLAFVQVLITKALMSVNLQALESTMLVVLRKPDSEK